MGRTPDTSLKRKRPDPKSTSTSLGLSDSDRVLYDLIKSKTDMGIWIGDMKREKNLPDHVVKKSLKSLQGKKLIKEVVSVQNKGKKYYMAVEFEPSKELTGGAWYVDGNLDTDFIKLLKELCLRHVFKMKIATTEGILESIRRSGVIKFECTTQQITEILNVLVLDNEIMALRSTETGEFASIPFETVCYKSTGKGASGKVVSKTGAMASIPCGVCPRISECTPDGIISPKTCVYFTKWLDF